MRISDWSSDVCSSDLADVLPHVERRHGQHFEPLWLDIAGDVIEQLRRVAPRARVGGEEAEVGIDARGDRVIVAGAEVAIGAIALPLAAHDHRDLRVRLPLDEAVDDLHAGAFELVRWEEHTAE